jgi:hypothetical protein
MPGVGFRGWKPTGASAAVQGDRQSVPSMGRILLDERSQPELVTPSDPIFPVRR